LRGDSLHGLIVVDKPAGLSSAAVVHRVRGRLGVRRAGHTGTLDPLATGVLPVCVGDATKLAGYLIAEDKAYRATIELGAETDTYDAEGEVVARDAEAAARVTRAQVDAAIARRTGPQLQEPPLYSAIKIGGRRMHELARAGEAVERAPRAVTIHTIAVVELAATRLVIDVECTKGTYIRSLAHDLGRDLGCGAHLCALRRTRTGPYGEDQAIVLDHLDRRRAATALVPMPRVTGMPSLVVEPALEPLVALGVVLSAGALGAAIPEVPVFQLVSQDGRLLALVGIERDHVRYHRVFGRLTGAAGSSTLRRPNPT
jgi:tRNA pseudouridine55 synthase